MPSEKAYDSRVDRAIKTLGPDALRRLGVLPRGIDPSKWMQAKNQKAVMKAVVTEHGSVLVNCPYCVIYYRKENKIDVTRFVETDREHITYCSEQHRVVFRPTGQWREERQKMGLQVK